MVKDQIGTRLELRLGDPSDSEMDRRVAVHVPVGHPGRGLTPDRLHMLIALPRLDSQLEPETLADGVAAATQELPVLYGDCRAPTVRMLPAQVDQVQVIAGVEADGAESDGAESSRRSPSSPRRCSCGRWTRALRSVGVGGGVIGRFRLGW
ncbi:hypothetical protein ACLMAJ_17680 [Nocardia sp. KC 131]|uniref:hypothetical protein n=1 Tax=Nocardia arseniciresistens TaxID=3392119 RepID=UPI00398F12BD